jgi:polyphosphate glucokinase
VLKLTRGWRFDVISMGYPGVVRHGEPAEEPHNLGAGWVGFDFRASFGCPVRLINDAAMQALGAYDGGTMLFLGLGTGLGSAIVVDGTVVALELGHLHCSKRHVFEHYLGDQGRKRLGEKRWREKVKEVVEGFRRALLPDYIVLGGGNVARLKRLPRHTRRGSNADAFAGGCRLWVRQPRRRRAARGEVHRA